MEGSLPRPLAGETVTMWRAGAGGSGVVCASVAAQLESRNAREESFIFLGEKPTTFNAETRRRGEIRLPGFSLADCIPDMAFLTMPNLLVFLRVSAPPR